ncbi:MAG: hypothetical protein ACYDDU_10655 [Dermatophilaceae bacterium]
MPGVTCWPCLVAIMSMGSGYRCVSQDRLAAVTAGNGGAVPVVSSAGALIDALTSMGVRRTAILTPYLMGHARRLDLAGVDALVLSACVQMPSLAAVQKVEDELGLPVVTASTATARSILLSLGITPQVREAGQLLAG